MQKNLVIVESPAKAKTIEKFLGKDFKVLSSYGHIRDLSKKDFGIDMENHFKPIYIISPDKKKLVSELKKNAKDSEMVWLASDEDREGEAIAWHLYETLKLDKKNTKRIVFHEITKTAILDAIKNPRDIDINLVNAQQARRILDRIVGFELSPILWKKIKPSLSAGRVQSVAVRLIVEREREINNFTPDNFYRIIPEFILNNGAILKSTFTKKFKSKEEILEILEKCKDAEFKIDTVTTRPLKRSPSAPFTTSTLQQEASRKLGFSVSQTMRIAQMLYESGKITYMRTDSVNLSGLAINTAKEEILKTNGEKYLKTRQFHTKAKGAQEAHEAIRPTYMNTHEIDGSAQEKKLYQLIWKRTIASQMADALFEKTTATIAMSNCDEKIEATGEALKFDGFLKVYMDPENGNEEKMLPPLNENQKLEVSSITATERFTQKPPRYTEASLVHKMEELGIGRPSTYAPTIVTIQDRDYVVKEDKEGTKRDYTVIKLENKEIKESVETENTGYEKSKLFPTDIGMVVNDFLIECFPNIMDYNFTASVEKEFDQIAEGKEEWDLTLEDFYKSFHPAVEKASEYQKHKVGERVLGNDPKTGRIVSVRIGRFGPLAQIGTVDDEEKPLFASLRKGQHLETITFEEVMDLFKLPRNVGMFEEKTVTVAIGRFGPYVRHNNKFVSIPKTIDPLDITLEQCTDLILKKREADKNKIIKVFIEEPEIQILKGRFGPYILFEKNNYKILDKEKKDSPESLTREECMAFIEKQGIKPPKKTATKAKKASAKKSTPKTKRKTSAKKQAKK